MKTTFTEWSTTNKEPSPKTKIFDESIIFIISEIPLSLSEKSILEKGLSFCPEIPGYDKLKLMDDLFRFYKNLWLREFFHEDTKTDINNNTEYIKTMKRTVMSKQLKNPHFTHHKININHQQNITVEGKLAIKNLQSHQDIIFHSVPW